MKGILAIKFTERRRKICASLLVWVYTKCLISSIINVLFGFYLWAELHHHPKLLPVFKNDSIPLSLIIVSGFGFVINIVKIKLFVDFHTPVLRLRWVRLINWILTLNWLLAYALLALGSLCLVIKKTLNEALKVELLEAMNKYRDDLNSKVEIDRIQISFKCCGTVNYSDWFNVTWMDHTQDILKFVFAETIENSANLKSTVHGMVDNVPWSCCDPSSLRPCIHYGVMHNNLHYNYDYRVRDTLYDRGCLEPLIIYFGDYFMQYFAISTYFISTIEGIALTGAMYLKSSVFEVIKQGSLTDQTNAYLFGGACFVKDIRIEYEKLLSQKEKLKAETGSDGLCFEDEPVIQQLKRMSKSFNNGGKSQSPLIDKKASVSTKTKEDLPPAREKEKLKAGITAHILDEDVPPPS